MADCRDWWSQGVKRAWVPESSCGIPVVHHRRRAGHDIWIPVDHMEPNQEHSRLLATGRR